MSSRGAKHLVLFAVLSLAAGLLVALPAAVAADGVIYVDQSATGAGDGSSWADAYPELQEAFQGLTGGETIWVAEGTYYPDYDPGTGTRTGDISASFELRDLTGVEIYGGFPAGGSVFEARDPKTYVTRLSGDLDGDDDDAFSNVTDNARYVMLMHLGGSHVVDGLTISGGYAYDVPAAPPEQFPRGFARGGGIFNNWTTLTTRNVTFERNAGVDGGGLYAGIQTLVENCLFVGNGALRGGGLLGLDVDVVGSGFVDNVGDPEGGWSQGAGAAIVDGTIRESRFEGNAADSGGALKFYGDGSAVMADTVVVGNTASAQAGGILITGVDPSSVYLSNVTIAGNTAGGNGGGIWMDAVAAKTVRIVNSLFSGNAAQYGGAFDNQGVVGQDVVIANSVVWSNTADLLGGIRSEGPGVVVANSILWGNTNGEVGGGDLPAVTHSVVQGGFPGGTEIVDADPLLVDPDGPDDTVGTADDDPRIAGNSPAVDAGSNAEVPADTADLDGDSDTGEPVPLDARGAPRFFDVDSVPDTGTGTSPLVDIGAFEVGPIYVDESATGAGTGTSWADAFTELRSGLDIASTGDQVLVAEGTYLPDYDPVAGAHTGDPAEVFTVPDGVVLLGGYPAGGGDASSRDPDAHPVVLSGDLNADDLPDHVNVADNSLAVLDASNSSVDTLVDGFIVTDAAERGLYASDGDLTIRNCRFDDNHGLGALLEGNSDTAIFDSSISRNVHDGAGGGMYAPSSGHPVLVRVTVADNDGGNGGGIFAYDMTIVSSVFRGNSSCYECDGGINGGALKISNGSVVNSVFAGNRGYQGSAIRVWFGDVTVVNSTFSGNDANGGATIQGSTSSSLTLVNSILWGNSDGTGATASIEGFPTNTVSWSTVEGGFAGTGVLDSDPLFTDADGPDGVSGTADDDVSLTDASPAIDAGDVAGLPGDSWDLDGDDDTGEKLPVDLLGNPRRFDHPNIDTGLGTGSLPDHGAIERIAHAPVAVADSAQTDEETRLDVGAPGVLGNDSDADGDDLTAVLTAGPGHAADFHLNADGSFTYLPEADWSGVDSFFYRAADAGLQSAPVQVSITVDPVNDPPVAVDDTGAGYSVLEGSGFEGLAPGVLFNDTDPEGDPLTVYDADPGTPGIQPVQAPAHGTLTLNLDGSHSYTHDGSETTSDSFTYRAFDGTDASNTATVTITVTPTDDAPVAADDGPYSVTEVGLLSVGRPGLLFNDADAEGDDLTAVLVSEPLHAAAFELRADGSFTYRPQAPFAGTDTFTYRAVAGGKQSNIASVAIDVSAALFCDGLHVTILGTPGDDEISGTAGDDVIDGGFGNDRINGRAGNDTICGGDGEDLLVGGPGDDVLSGGDDRDVLRGADGDDDLRGGAGSDIMLPEAGGGVADGGPGSDLIDFRAMVAPGTARGTVTVDLGAGTAELTLFGSSGAPDTVYLTEVRRVEKVFGTFEGDDVLTGDGRRNVLKGFGGADVLAGGGDDDDLIGGTEDDVLDGGGGADLIKGQGHDDLMTGGPGNDTLRGGTGRDTISGEDGDDFLRAGLRVPSMTVDLDPLDGGPGDDLCVNSPNVTACERVWPQTLL